MKILRKEIAQQEQQTQNPELFIQKVKEYMKMETLTPYAAHELIRTICIGTSNNEQRKSQASHSYLLQPDGFYPTG